MVTDVDPPQQKKWNKTKNKQQKKSRKKNKREKKESESKKAEKKDTFSEDINKETNNWLDSWGNFVVYFTIKRGGYSKWQRADTDKRVQQ